MRRSKLDLGVAVVVGAMVLCKIDDFDIWWHIATGRWIWQHAAVPRVDVLSWTSHGALAYTEALAQLYFYGAFALDGAPGVVLSAALLASALTVLAVLLARSADVLLRVPAPGTGASALSAALWAAASYFRFGPKTDMFTFLGLAAVLLLLARAARTGSVRPLAAIVLVLAVWANAHRGGTIALPVLASFSVGWAIERKQKLSKACAAATLLGAAALCVNPAGIGYVTSAFDLASRVTFRAVLPEWRHVYARFFYADDPFFTVMIVVWVADLLRRRRFDVTSVVAALLLLVSFSSVRFVPLAATAMLPGVASGVASAGGALAARTAGAVRPLIRRLVAGTATGLVLAVCYASNVSPSAVGLGTKWWVIPVDATSFLKQNPPPGRMFNAFDLGGYLAFALAPGQKVFIDGRNDTVYDDAFFASYVRADRDPVALFRLLDRYRVTYAVIECSTLECRDMRALQVDPRWVPVYFDDVAVVMVRRSDATRAYLAQHAYQTLRPARAIDRLLGFARDPDAALLEADVMRNVRQAPRSMRAWYMAAAIERMRGRMSAYQVDRARFEALAAERGSDLQAP